MLASFLVCPFLDVSPREAEFPACRRFFDLSRSILTRTER